MTHARADTSHPHAATPYRLGLGLIAASLGLGSLAIAQGPSEAGPWLVMAVVITAGVILLPLALGPRSGPWDPFEVGSIFAAFYGLSFLSTPLSIGLFESDLGVTHVWTVLLLAAMGGAAFWTGYSSWAGPALVKANRSVPRPPRLSSSLPGIWATGAVGTCLLAVFLASVGVRQYLAAGWLEKRQMSIGLGASFFGLTLLQITAVMLIGVALEGPGRRRATGFVGGLLLAGSIALAFVSGQRRAMFFPVLAVLITIHHGYRRLRLRRWLIPGIVVAVLLLSYSQFRGYITQRGELVDYVARNASVQWLDPARGYFAAPFSNLDLLMDVLPDHGGYRWGSTYAALPETLLPSGVYDRPPTPTEWLAAEFYPDDFARGGGRGLSILAEAFMNFGLVGIVLVPLAAGGLCRAVDVYLLRRDPIDPYLVITYAVAGPFSIFLLVTIDFSSAVKYAVIASVPILALRAMAQSRGVSSRSSRRAGAA